jgi:hypothetical protein
MRFVLYIITSLVVLGAPTAVRAKEEPDDRSLSELSCEELKALFSEAETYASTYEPPPPPPECRALCVASQLAACSTSPKACGGFTMIMLADMESSCFCDEFNHTPKPE